jgi:hypothetical protein
VIDQALLQELEPLLPGSNLDVHELTWGEEKGLTQSISISTNPFFSPTPTACHDLKARLIADGIDFRIDCENGKWESARKVPVRNHPNSTTWKYATDCENPCDTELEAVVRLFVAVKREGVQIHPEVKG